MYSKQPPQHYSLVFTHYAETADLSFIISNPCCGCASSLPSAAICLRRRTNKANAAATPSNAAPVIIIVDDDESSADDTAENDV